MSDAISPSSDAEVPVPAPPGSESDQTDIPASRKKPGAPATPLQWAWKVITSFGLVVVVLLLLTILTLLGTWEQKDHGLFDTQEKYFESVLVIHHFEIGNLSIPIILPGAYILMVVLFFNLLAGAIVKARKSWKTPGMLIAHSGILLLLIGAFVSHHFSTKGHMALYKGEESNQYQSYQGWQLEVMPLDENDRPTKAFIITEDQLNSVRGDRSRVFSSDDLPFGLKVSHYLRNAKPVLATSSEAAGVDLPEADGYQLVELDAEKEAERNVGGVYVESLGGSGEETAGKKGILWAGAAAPWIVESEGKKWALSLDRERWDVPFSVRLDEFIFDRHPGTTMAKKFESRITKLEAERATPVQIRMNEPLRHRGYTFFQESYGPSDESDPAKMYSQFSVVKNPTDQWPLYALIVTFAGMAIHFVQKLLAFISRALKSLNSTPSHSGAPSKAKSSA